jgi:hypothetical protein
MGVPPAASASSTSTRRQLLWVCLAPVLIACLGGALHSYFLGPLGFLFGFLAVLAILGLWVAGLVKTVLALFRRRWTAAGGRFLVIAASVPLSVAGLASEDYIHLALSYPYYVYKIEQTSLRPVRFYWGDSALLAIDDSRNYTLIYDDSGEVEATLGERQVDGGLWVTTTRLAGHFFLQVAYLR